MAVRARLRATQDADEPLRTVEQVRDFHQGCGTPIKKSPAIVVSSLRSIELSLIDEVFRGGERGYILDFSNRTFSDFFNRELYIDIDAPQYAVDGISKGKRLRCFLAQVDDGTAARALKVLWEHREALRPAGTADPMPRAASQIAALVARLEGSAPVTPANVVAAPVLDAIDFARLNDLLLAVRDLAPHSRGYAFERFLTELFEAFRMNPREPFRITGEQIDGSFELASETYLVEAKWLNRKIGAEELHTFAGKVGQKAMWARGLFISFGGFTADGLIAFGRGHRVIGLEGRELHDALGRGVGIDRLIAAKARRAAETGDVFAPIEALSL